GYSVGSTNVATVTIADDDATEVTLTGGGTVTEANTAATVEITVELGRALVAGETVEVPLSVAGVTLSDYELSRKSGTGVNTGVSLVGRKTLVPRVKFANAGAQTAVLVFAARQDQIDEGASETATIKLGTLSDGSLMTNVGGGAVASATQNTVTVTVGDDDGTTPPSVLSVVSVTASDEISEGETATFTLTATPAPAHDLAVSYRVFERGGFTSGQAGTRAVTIGTSGTATITIPTIDDAVAGRDGLIRLLVIDGYGYEAHSQDFFAIVTVIDNDRLPPRPTLYVTWAVTDAVMTEGSSSDTAEVEVRLSRPLESGESLDVDLDRTHVGTVSFSLAGSPSGVSFDSALSRLTFSGAGAAQTATVTVTAAAGAVDGAARGSAAYPFSISAMSGVAGAVGYIGSAYQRQLLIIDSANTGPAVSVWNGSANAGYIDEGSYASLLFDLSAARSQDTAVRFEVVGWGEFPTTSIDLGSASNRESIGNGHPPNITRWVNADAQYEIVIPAGFTKAITTIPVSADGIRDGDEMFAVHILSTSPGTSVGATTQHLFVASDVSPAPDEPREILIEHPEWGWVKAPLYDSLGESGQSTGDNTGRVGFTVDDGVEEADRLSQGRQPTPPPPPPPTPEVTITSAVGATEGGTVSFTLTASPAPTADLEVAITVAASGDFGFGPAPASVTIPASGSATVTVATAADDTDEPDGSVTLTLDAGSGYTVGALSSETAAVFDDDDPPPPPPPPPVQYEPDQTALAGCGAEKPTLSISSPTASRSDAAVGFEVSLDCAPASGVSVVLVSVRDGAVGDNIPVTFTSGQLTATVTVPIGDEQQLSLAIGWAPGVANRTAQGDVAYTD
ncbi:MAG: hypothetical protein OXM54_12255, partial [Acidimicrobiaceae bacterium]|nr:hypothetical protein [Acidimicrobiaceae bacterium]